MIYQWKIPSLYDVSAQEAGEEIETCKNSEGFITPAAVIEKAKPETSVIHGCFEWDDQSAAQRYRLHQAGELIRNIVVVSVSGDDSRDVAVRAFVNVKSETERGYKAISAVVDNQAEYEYLLDCAKNDMRTFTQKYAALRELREVFTAIREALA